MQDALDGPWHTHRARARPKSVCAWASASPCNPQGHVQGGTRAPPRRRGLLPRGAGGGGAAAAGGAVMRQALDCFAPLLSEAQLVRTQCAVEHRPARAPRRTTCACACPCRRRRGRWCACSCRAAAHCTPPGSSWPRSPGPPCSTARARARGSCTPPARRAAWRVELASPTHTSPRRLPRPYPQPAMLGQLARLRPAAVLRSARCWQRGQSAHARECSSAAREPGEAPWSGPGWRGRPPAAHARASG